VDADADEPVEVPAAALPEPLEEPALVAAAATAPLGTLPVPVPAAEVVAPVAPAYAVLVMTVVFEQEQEES